MCELAAPPAHGFLSPAGAVAIGGRAEVVCDDGYAPAGDASLLCTPLGEFAGAAACAPVECPPYPAPAHGAAEPGGPVRFNETVALRCAEGYRLAGPELVTCLADRTYSEVGRGGGRGTGRGTGILGEMRERAMGSA